MTIGEKIRALRREQGVTQEQLAESLNISYQAVSKWENNTAMPDISLVIPIASFFGVTTDTLFDLDGRSQEEEIRRIEKESSRLAGLGLEAEQYELWEKAVEKYPRNIRCQTFFSRMLHRVSSEASRQDEERIAAGRRAIEFCERIVRDSTDTFCKYSSIQLLVLEYSDQSKPYFSEEKAMEYANSAASFWVCREVLAAHALTGDKARAANQNNLTLFIEKICSIIMGLGKNSDEEKILSCETCLSLWKLIFYDENYLFYHCRIWRIYSRMAEVYAGQKNREKTLEALKSAAFHAMNYDRLPDKSQSYTSIFADKLTGGKIIRDSQTDELRQEMKKEVYDFLRDDLQTLA